MKDCPPTSPQELPHVCTARTDANGTMRRKRSHICRWLVTPRTRPIYIAGPFTQYQRHDLEGQWRGMRRSPEKAEGPKHPRSCTSQLKASRKPGSQRNDDSMQTSKYLDGSHDYCWANWLKVSAVLTAIVVKPEPSSYPFDHKNACLLYTSPSPRDGLLSRMPSSA